jgi:predicted pyridoxine 5'-phosphate oxidase superfamily flavin-nucleotide-binding protein
VKEIQRRKGSRELYARRERGAGFPVAIDDELAEFIARQGSFFIATASADGQPYVQHRGGPPGFLHVLDEHTLAFADFRGNRQYISLGNLSENPKVQLLLLDYAERTRVKIWGEARVVDADPALLARLEPANYAGRPEQAIVIRVSAWDYNCRQHLPRNWMPLTWPPRSPSATRRSPGATARSPPVTQESLNSKLSSSACAASSNCGASPDLQR